eukprot:1141113-Pelagomonas_calceolata.AAC.5
MHMDARFKRSKLEQIDAFACVNRGMEGGLQGRFPGWSSPESRQAFHQNSLPFWPHVGSKASSLILHLPHPHSLDCLPRGVVRRHCPHTCSPRCRAMVAASRPSFMTSL